MSLVDIDNLWVRYGKTLAVRGLTFSIPQGAVFGFIGPNGAGKTSTIKVLSTLIKPAFGRVSVGGHDVARHPDRVREVIGYMPDFFGVYDDLTVTEYLHFFAAACRMDRSKRKTVVGDVLALTDLTEKKESPVDALSRGMKQRLGLARVLLNDPQLLLLDEPASGLDPRARIEIRELLKELRNMGKTILVSSHILHELSQICTRIGIIEQGEMRAQGSLDDIYAYLNLMRLVHVRILNVTDEMVEAVKRIEGVGSVERTVDRISIRVRENCLAPEDLLVQLQALGARISMFQPEAMDMETVFMKLTEGKTS